METIAAISTPRGNGGIGIIRVSGENALTVVNKIFVPYKKDTNGILNMKGYSAKLGKIMFNGKFLDEAIVLVFKKPYSYTGENVVEVSCHGGLVVLNLALNALLNSGARLAEAGEFTKRAVLNGKMSIIEAESVINIINAKSKNAARLAFLNKEGILNKKILKIKNNIVNILAEVSVSIDYPEDEDFNVLDISKLKNNINNICTNLESLLDTYESSRIISSGLNTVIVGKPNVGKSSLMNAITGIEKSIITNIPGTTRDIIEESVTFKDITLNLKDTAGIRESENLIEKIGINKTLEKLKQAELVLAVFDGSKEISKEDENLVNLLKDIPYVIGIINKIDLANKLDFNFLEKNIKTLIKISAKENIGINELKNTIKNFVQDKISDPEQGILTTNRQYESVKKSLGYAKKAANALNSNTAIDIIFHFLDLSLKEILLLTGELTSEAVLDEVFSKFCVGK